MYVNVAKWAYVFSYLNKNINLCNKNEYIADQELADATDVHLADAACTVTRWQHFSM